MTIRTYVAAAAFTIALAVPVARICARRRTIRTPARRVRCWARGVRPPDRRPAGHGDSLRRRRRPGFDTARDRDRRGRPHDRRPRRDPRGRYRPRPSQPGPPGRRHRRAPPGRLEVAPLGFVPGACHHLVGRPDPFEHLGASLGPKGLRIGLLGRRPKLIEGSGGRNPQVFGVVASLLADPIGLVVGRTDDPSRLVVGQPHDLGRIGLGPPQSHRRADALVIAGGRSAARHGAGSGCGPQVAGHRPEQVLHLRRLEAVESHGESSLFEAVVNDRVLRGGDVVPWFALTERWYRPPGDGPGNPASSTGPLFDRRRRARRPLGGCPPGDDGRPAVGGDRGGSRGGGGRVRPVPAAGRAAVAHRRRTPGIGRGHHRRGLGGHAGEGGRRVVLRRLRARCARHPAPALLRSGARGAEPAPGPGPRLVAGGPVDAHAITTTIRYASFAGLYVVATQLADRRLATAVRDCLRKRGDRRRVGHLELPLRGQGLGRPDRRRPERSRLHPRHHDPVDAAAVAPAGRHRVAVLAMVGLEFAGVLLSLSRCCCLCWPWAASGTH